MEVKIKKLYGFNYVSGERIFSFDESKRTHLVYGTNASGKSSFSKSIDLISKGIRYEKILKEDSDKYTINLKYEDINFFMDENSDSGLSAYKDRIFVYNKNYIGENLNPNLENGTIEIGNRITELRKLSKGNIEYQNSIFTNIQEKLKAKLQLTSLNSNTLTKNKNITKFVAGRERKNIELIKEISNTIDERIFSKIKRCDLINDNISKFKKISEKLKNITRSVIEGIRDSHGDYKIDSLEDIDFYSNVLNELDRKTFDRCPLCFNEFFDQEAVKNKIKNLLKEIKQQSEFGLILNDVNSFSTNESYFGAAFKGILDEVLKGNLNLDVIGRVNEELEEFDEQYDSILLKYIDYKIDDNDYKTFVDNNASIKQIIEENIENSEDTFIKLFNDLLEKLFGNNNFLRAQKRYEEINGEKFYSIQLIINGFLKEGVSILEFFKRVLSESQKARISLAYYFASILSKNRNEKIICIFDDPLDSYDSNGKYVICSELKKFCEKQDFYSSFNYDSFNILLTHSIDFIRIIQLFNVSWNIYVLNSFSMTEIENDDLYVFDGDSNILIKKLGFTKKIGINEMIPLTAILRNVCSDATKVLCIDRNIKNNVLVGSSGGDTQYIQKELSNKVIHGFGRLDSFTLSDYKDFLDTKCNIHVINIDPSDLGKCVSTYMKEYIEAKKTQELSFIDDLFFKNYLSLYIRSFADRRLAEEIFTFCLKVDGSNYRNVEEVSNTIFEMGKKIKKLEDSFSNISNNNDRDRVKKMINFVSNHLVLLNDFSHSENAFISPIIDVAKEDLLKLYKEVETL